MSYTANQKCFLWCHLRLVHEKEKSNQWLVKPFVLWVSLFVAVDRCVSCGLQVGWIKALCVWLRDDLILKQRQKRDILEGFSSFLCENLRVMDCVYVAVSVVLLTTQVRIHTHSRTLVTELLNCLWRHLSSRNGTYLLVWRHHFGLWEPVYGTSAGLLGPMLTYTETRYWYNHWYSCIDRICTWRHIYNDPSNVGWASNQRVF